ncbi:MAG: FAD binding domain-containing protein [Paracoccaceae bacterium]
MKAADFSYARPKTVQEAIAILADPEADAMPLAGGQSLMPMMNFRLAAPGTLVDLNGIERLRGIEVSGGVVRIGAMTRYCELAASPGVATHAPLFGMALPHIAHPAIRNRGTIGGSVSLADPAAEMPALLLALDATICVEGASGPRRIAADEFFLGMYETALDKGELVTEILVPQKTERDRFAFYELARRHGDFAMVGVAVRLPDTPASSFCRIAFFSISDRAVRATDAEAALSAGLSDEAVEAAIASLAELQFAGDLNAAPDTKRYLAGVVLKRALEGLN